MTNNLKINDTAWAAIYEQRQVQITCPICFGKKQVTLILGDDSSVILPCEYCGKGYTGPLGYCNEYHFVSKPELVVVAGIDMRSFGDKTEIRYITSDNRSFDSDELFATKEEAEEKIKSKIAAAELNEKERSDWAKFNGKKNYSWNAGYHKKETESLKQRLEYHEKCFTVCKAASKEEKCKI